MPLMISFLGPLPVGNAMRVLLAPPAGAVEWRLLRKTADTFIDQNDVNAAVIYDGADESSILDTAALTNGTVYYYKEFDFDGAAWTSSPTVFGTPASTGEDIGPDVLSIVRDRLELWLRAVVARGALSNSLGYIPVLTAPPLFEDTQFPIVTVHMQTEGTDIRGVGEIMSSDILDTDANEVIGSEGWLSKVTIQIMAWSTNPDERIALRKAIQQAIAGNLAVFDDVGMIQIEISGSDMEDLTSYNIPVYQSLCSLSCHAPTGFAGSLGTPVTDVEISISTTF